MKIFSISILWIIASSCFDQKYKEKVAENSLKPNVPVFINSIINKFSLPYNKEAGVDSNSLIFFGRHNFDTSFFVQLYKEASTVNGILYQIIPIYHSDDENYADTTNRLLFFEGYSFKIDSIKWMHILNRAKSNLLSNKDTVSKDQVCLDCPFYFILHDSKILSSSNNNRILFQTYERYLKDSLLNHFIVQREPKMYKRF